MASTSSTIGIVAKIDDFAQQNMEYGYMQLNMIRSTRMAHVSDSYVLLVAVLVVCTVGAWLCAPSGIHWESGGVGQ